MYVYFIGVNELDVIKVGRSKDPIRRLQFLQTGCPYEMSLLQVVRSNDRSSEVEKAFHLLFEHLLLRGEWFHLTREVNELLLAIQEGQWERYERIMRIMMWQNLRYFNDKVT